MAKTSTGTYSILLHQLVPRAKIDLFDMVGTEKYIPPERMDPKTSRDVYGIKSDVWSFGLTLAELALLGYPYKSNNSIKRMMIIIKGPAPVIPEGRYSDKFRALVALCLQKVIFCV